MLRRRMGVSQKTSSAIRPTCSATQLSLISSFVGISLHQRRSLVRIGRETNGRVSARRKVTLHDHVHVPIIIILVIVLRQCKGILMAYPRFAKPFPRQPNMIVLLSEAESVFWRKISQPKMAADRSPCCGMPNSLEMKEEPLSEKCQTLTEIKSGN